MPDFGSVLVHIGSESAIVPLASLAEVLTLSAKSPEYFTALHAAQHPSGATSTRLTASNSLTTDFLTKAKERFFSAGRVPVKLPPSRALANTVSIHDIRAALSLPTA